MDQATIKLLRQAAGYIKDGKQKAARKILVELLRDDPEVDQAWYMLSFTVPVVDRQIYALEQALRVNPHNDKALTRLLKLQGSEQQTVDEAFSKSADTEEIRVEPAQPASIRQEIQEDVSGDDLLTQRLLGEDKSEVAPFTEETAASTLSEASISDEVVSEEPVGVEEADSEEEKKEEKSTKKVFGIRRSVFILIVLIAIFLSIGSLFYSDQIKSFVANLQNGGSGNQGEVVDNTGDDDLGGVVPTPEPTPTEGIDLPPVWTPTPTVLVEPTQAPDSPFTELSSILIDFDSLPVIDAATAGEFDEIRAQMQAIMDDVEFPETVTYAVQKTEIQDVLTEFARLNEYHDAVQKAGIIFAALGLSESIGQTDTLMQNMWADPNGTLLFADTGNVLIADFKTNPHQRFSYAQSVAQTYRNAQNPFVDLGLYPMCSVVDQECEVVYALAKGEAAFFAEMWAEEYFSESLMEEFLAEPVNWFTVPAGETPPPFMEVSLSLPRVYGKDLVDGIFELDRMEAVDDLYNDLPTTTEQLLHLEKYLAHEEAVEIDGTDISETLGVSWQNVYSGSLGEWKTYLLMAHGADLDAQMDEETALEGAAGWGGDNAQMFYRLSLQDFVVVVEWAWDTDTDAVQFTNVFSGHLQNQSGANPVTIFEETTCFESDGQVDCIFSNGGNVVWVKAPDQTIITQILEEFGLTS